MIRPLIAVAWPKADYLRSIEQAGGEPRVLTPDTDPLPAALDACDGVLLTGGLDIDPTHYGESARHETVEIDPARDAYEMQLTRLALERDMPVLAICRGVQVLNVASGGTLVQDIPSALSTNLLHRHVKATGDDRTSTHDVQIRAGTCLATLMRPRLDGRGYVGVNSRHHQSVKTVAPGFIVSATAPDGVIEAIENPDATFCVGVQWHPENFWKTGEFRSLFEGLVKAAAKAQATNP